MENAEIFALSQILVQYAKKIQSMMANVDLSVQILVFLAKMVNVRRSVMIFVNRATEMVIVRL